MGNPCSTRFHRRWPAEARVLFLGAALALSLACGGKKEKDAPPPGPAGSQAGRPPGEWSLKAAAAPYKGATLRVIGEALPPLEAMAKLAPTFEQETGIKLEIEMLEYSEVLKKATLDLNSRRGYYDIVLHPHRELGRLVKNGHVREIAPYMNNPALRDPTFKPEEQLQQRLWKEISWYEGKVYGAPFTALTMYLWYRKDLLEDPKERAAFQAKYGYEMKVPTTWKEYTDLAAFFHRPGEGLYGTSIQGKRHPALWYEWLNFLYSFGGDMLETDTGSACGPVIVNSPKAVAALDYYKSLMAYSSPDTLNFFWDDVMALMQQGKVFQLIMWNDATYAVENPKQSKVVGKMGFDLIPQGDGGKVGQIEGWTYLIPTRSKNPEAAYLFIQWMMGFDRQQVQHVNGGASARPDVYDHPAVKALSYSKASMETNAVAKPKPTIPEAPQISEILVLELSLALTNAKSTKAALDTAAAEISKLLGACAPLKYPVN